MSCAAITKLTPIVNMYAIIAFAFLLNNDDITSSPIANGIDNYIIIGIDVENFSNRKSDIINSSYIINNIQYIDSFIFFMFVSL